MENLKVYIKINSNNCVTEINSSKFITYTTDWLQIDEGIGDRFEYAQNNYLGKPLCEMRQSTSIYIYKYVDGAVAERTAEEIQVDINNLPIAIEQKTNNEIGEMQLIIMDALATTEENRLANEINAMEIQATIFESILAIQEAVTA